MADRWMNNSLRTLGFASKRAENRMLLHPDVIEMALARLGRKLTLDEQRVVLRAVGDRTKVNWPEWWEVK